MNNSAKLLTNTTNTTRLRIAVLNFKNYKLVRHTGLEPASDGVEVRGIIHYSNAANKLASRLGLEPRMLLLENKVLPLHYRDMNWYC